MAAGMCFRIGESKVKTRPYASKEACQAALAEAIRRNRERGHQVRREDAAPGRHPQWIVETSAGEFVAMYQLTDSP